MSSSVKQHNTAAFAVPETHESQTRDARTAFGDQSTKPFVPCECFLSAATAHKEGFMRGFSVGFIPLEQPKMIRDTEDRVTGYEFTSQELLELSVTR